LAASGPGEFCAVVPAGGVAGWVIGDRVAVYRRQQVAPERVVVAEGRRLRRAAGAAVGGSDFSLVGS